jgi:hypothetical protein
VGETDEHEEAPPDSPRYPRLATRTGNADLGARDPLEQDTH